MNKIEARTLVSSAAASLQSHFMRIDAGTQEHLRHVLDAFHAVRLGAQHLHGVDGYGHGDLGREALDEAYARLFGCEAAIVRVHFHSGTHAIAAALFGVLRPGDELLSAAGEVYDTLQEVIGTRQGSTPDAGSLADWGVTYRATALNGEGRIDVDGVVRELRPCTRVVLIQRSFGYEWRPSVTLSDIRAVVRAVRGAAAHAIVFVDNCYGEFTEHVEPVHESVGADLMAGSLIKNLGGGIAPSGAYVAGRADLVERARLRLAAPGVGGGATLGTNRALLQGLFLAPQMVGEACKGTLLVGEVMARMGYRTNPARGESGFVCAVQLGDREKVMRFCEAVQRNGPVGAHIKPTAGVTPGYGDEVVFAQSSFIDGSTLELSADGPLREPYIVFAQGGMHWTHWAIALEEVVESVGRMEAAGILKHEKIKKNLRHA